MIRTTASANWKLRCRPKAAGDVTTVIRFAYNGNSAAFAAANVAMIAVFQFQQKPSTLTPQNFRSLRVPAHRQPGSRLRFVTFSVADLQSLGARSTSASVPGAKR